ncbi:hypothetical protein [Gordonia terrae]|uniref:hypothetical protein n=1 Tax=Gordonia terrae TaxID=2055 RepID=UPI003F6D9463
MARDHTARARIQQYLSSSGPIEDPSGYATKLLKEAIGYSGSSVAFIQLIAAMDSEGEIERDIRGKRTYRISSAKPVATSSPRAGIADPGVGSGVIIDIDYDRLAKAIVREFWVAASAHQPVATPAADRVVADVDHIEVDRRREEYARRLEDARSHLDQLLSEAAEYARP